MNTKGESQLMVEEAYASIDAPPPKRTGHAVPDVWATTRIALDQMLQTGMISRRKYLESLEGMAP